MSTAAEASDLVNLWWPLAGGIARRWGARHPWLEDCFTSAAGEALWKLATTHGHLSPPVFSGLVRQGVRWAILRRIRNERVRNPVAFEERPWNDAGNGETDLLGLLPDRGAETDARLDVTENVAALIDRAKLKPRQRELLVRHFADGETQTALARELGISGGRLRQIIGRAKEKLRRVAA